jgi:hypothetical protein
MRVLGWLAQPLLAILGMGQILLAFNVAVMFAAHDDGSEQQGEDDPGSSSKAAVAQHLFEFLAGDLCDHLAPHRVAHTQRIKRAPVVNRVVTLMSDVKLRGLHPIDRVKSGL